MVQTQEFPQQAIASCVMNSVERFHRCGVSFFDPPASLDTMYDELSLWKLVAEKIECPFAHQFSDEHFIVITRTTTKAEMREMYYDERGEEAFVKRLLSTKTR